jgi:hypothetical protein
VSVSNSRGAFERGFAKRAVFLNAGSAARFHRAASAGVLRLFSFESAVADTPFRRDSSRIENLYTM